MKNRAFTLVELMVAVAIIVLLVALLVPAVGKAKQEARNVKCMDNLRQIGIALTAYSAQHGGFIVERDYWYWISTQNGYNLQCGWQERLLLDGCVNVPAPRTGPYFCAGSGVFMCPDHDPEYQFGRGTPNARQPQAWNGNDCDSYGLNGYHDGKQLAAISPNRIWATDGWVRMTPNSASMRDMAGPHNAPYGMYHRHIGAGYYYTSPFSGVQRNTRGANFLMIDGRVERSAQWGHYDTYYGGYKLPNGSNASSPDQVPYPFNVWFSP